MRKLAANQNGFGFLAVLLVLAVIGAVAVVGLRVTGNDTTVPDAAATLSKSKVPSTISSKADVTEASAALDATDVDNGVNPSQLDSDLNSLL